VEIITQNEERAGLRRILSGRIIFVLVVLLVFAGIEILRERRPTFLRSGVRLNAYIGNIDDGTVTVVDLVRLAPAATVPVGPDPSGIRANPKRNEIWGVSSSGGYVWVLDVRTLQVTRISAGRSPFAIDFSADGTRAYVAASGSDAIVAIDTQTHSVVARGRAGRRPWIARVTPDGKDLLVSNRDDSTVSLLDASTLVSRAVIPTGPDPEQVAILPDGSKAFVSSGSRPQVSVIDLRHDVLQANLSLGGNPSDLILKPDGGELYIPCPETHGLVVVDTSTNEVGDYVLLGLRPTSATFSVLPGILYVSDSEASHIVPIAIDARQVAPPISVGQGPGASLITPGGDMLLVVDQISDDLAVVRSLASSSTGVSSPPGGLITLIPVGRHPRDLAVKMF
jgi:YVTN family beta-propeller protein